MEGAIQQFCLKNKKLKNRVNIKSYCAITSNKVICNGKVLHEENTNDFSAYLKSIYKKYCDTYPKFFKMDLASKLAFLTADLLLKETNITSSEKEELAIVLSNKSASLNTDRAYQESIQDEANYYPSPAIFVYTLPNIGIGEICIRHKIYGENAFFVSNIFNETLLSSYAQTLLSTNKTDNVLCGWVEVDNEEFSSFMYVLSKDEGEEYLKEKINSIYQSI